MVDTHKSRRRHTRQSEESPRCRADWRGTDAKLNPSAVDEVLARSPVVQTVTSRRFYSRRRSTRENLFHIKPPEMRFVNVVIGSDRILFHTAPLAVTPDSNTLQTTSAARIATQRSRRARSMSPELQRSHAPPMARAQKRAARIARAAPQNVRLPRDAGLAGAAVAILPASSLCRACTDKRGAAIS